MLLQAVEHSWDTSTLCENVKSKILFLDIVKHIEIFWNKEKDSVSGFSDTYMFQQLI